MAKILLFAYTRKKSEYVLKHVFGKYKTENNTTQYIYQIDILYIRIFYLFHIKT